ncbi:MAG: hypothetical protein BV456_06485 [Thermoplasmata archaeon M8B2D]|nr:MAG: hypothetical protein BV456_06485 [Thermoplasmata archaeon M8B2D]
MDVEQRYSVLKSESELIDSRIKEKQSSLKELKTERQALIDTKQVLIDSIKIINSHFKKKIETITSQVVKRVFKRDIKIEVNFETKPYGVEANIKVIENNIELDPMDDMGGSIIEVISLIIRLVLREISSERLRKTIILDEPFNWAGDLIILIGQIIKEFSKDIQFIILTHDDRLEDIADRIYRIERQDFMSRIIRIK